MYFDAKMLVNIHRQIQTRVCNFKIGDADHPQPYSVGKGKPESTGAYTHTSIMGDSML